MDCRPLDYLGHLAWNCPRRRGHLVYDQQNVPDGLAHPGTTVVYLHRRLLAECLTDSSRLQVDRLAHCSSEFRLLDLCHHRLCHPALRDRLPVEVRYYLYLQIQAEGLIGCRQVYLREIGRQVQLGHRPQDLQE